MGWNNTGRNITNPCPKCKGKLIQMEGSHSEQGSDGYFKYWCQKCGKTFETSNPTNIKCRGKLKEIKR